MSRMTAAIKRPGFVLFVILPVALVLEFFLLVGTLGISLPSSRGSAVSSYEIREKGTGRHFITRNKRFVIADLWSRNGSAVETLVLRESTITDRQEGVEGNHSIVRVEALDGKAVKWSLEEPGEGGRALDQVYEVTRYGCCGSANTYTYFALRDGRKLRSVQSELSSKELAALQESLHD